MNSNIERAGPLKGPAPQYFASPNGTGASLTKDDHSAISEMRQVLDLLWFGVDPPGVRAAVAQLRRLLDELESA
jgi:hypothetical protein